MDSQQAMNMIVELSEAVIPTFEGTEHAQERIVGTSIEFGMLLALSDPAWARRILHAIHDKPGEYELMVDLAQRYLVLAHEIMGEN